MRLHNIVPGILKIYIGSLIIIILGFVCFEVNSVQNNILELAFIIRDSMQESCRFLSQESFMLKSNDSNSLVVRGNSYNIESKDKNYIISGLFYDSNSYKDIMQSSQAYNFIQYLDSELDKHAVNSSNTKIAKNNNSYKILKNIMEGKSDYIKYGITPANLGFTYLDRPTLEKVFKWKLANKLSSLGIDKDDYRRRNTILTEDGINYFIRWNGFRIYLSNINVYVDDTNRIYIYNLSNEDDKEEYSKYTNISSDYYTLNGLPNDKDIRNYRIVYDVRWSLDIGYEGILPVGLIYKILQGNINVVFSTNTPNTMKNVLRGDSFNTEISKTTWNTSSNLTYAQINENTLWSPNNFIPIAQRAYFTLIN